MSLEITFSGPKKPPHTSSMVQFIFSFFGPLRSARTQKIIIGLDSFSIQCLIHVFGSIWIIHCTSDHLGLYIDYPDESCKFTVILFGFVLPNL